MKTTLLSILFVLRGFGWAQQLEFQYTSQQLNVYNSLTNDIPLFTQNFDDQVSSAIPIVPFTIGGQAYNTLFVSTNGFITLGQSASPTNYNPISQPPGTPVVAPFACNLESANSNARISYQIVNGFNNAPTSIIIQWQNVRRFGMQGESFSFQAKLNFTSWILPAIDFVYGDFSSVNTAQSTVEIGIRIGAGNAATNFQNIQVNNGGSWVPQQFGTSVNSNCLFPSSSGSAGVPPSGMTHQWFLLYNNNQPTVNTSPICNQNGNVVIYSNYDGGTLNINCDQNIPNLKIGICTYEPVIVNINGPFVGNITEVLYAGFNSNQNNNHCGLGNFTTSIAGVNPESEDIVDSSLVITFGNVTNSGTNKIKATKNGKDVEFAKRTKISCDKNHITGVTSRGSVIMTVHGFIDDDKKAVDEYKKAHSAEWLQVLGTKDFDIVEETEMGEDIRDIFDNEPELNTNEQ